MNLYYRALTIILLLLFSCKPNNSASDIRPKPKLAFISVKSPSVGTMLLDTIIINGLEVPDSTFKRAAVKQLSSPLGEFTIEKFSNMLNARTDDGVEKFYEKSLGVFYQRSLTWPRYGYLYSNDEIVNSKARLLINDVLSNPTFCDFPKPPNPSIKNFKTPKF